ncbi:hypothetical protein C8J56DRAFT_1025978 [Mycena floridula]|nr:hypothetical protein C8J56DRAFT_1025978 [Mycena floridula]
MAPSSYLRCFSSTMMLASARCSLCPRIAGHSSSNSGPVHALFDRPLAQGATLGSCTSWIHFSFLLIVSRLSPSFCPSAIFPYLGSALCDSLVLPAILFWQFTSSC